jgi:hypothetical protein
VLWPGSYLERAAIAITELHSSDCVLMAKAALESAFHGEGDLMQLLGTRDAGVHRYRREPIEAALA